MLGSMGCKSSKASVKETRKAIDAACKGSGYSCKSVSWDDVQRGTVDGSLSCYGGNITDTRLYAKSGSLLYTCRPNNWNEKLGRVNANDIAVVVGNHNFGGSTPMNLMPITLSDFLKSAGIYGAYAGLDTDTHLDGPRDRVVSVRFQTTFLPVDKSGATEFCMEAYNYNTLSDENPRNAIVLCTSQGIAFQQDGAGAKKLFHHAVDDNGYLHLYWLEAERSEHDVGGPQIESIEEATAAAVRRKSTASVIGIKEMGTRFNAIMTIQIPLKQMPMPISRPIDGWCDSPLSQEVTEELPSFCSVSLHQRFMAATRRCSTRSRNFGSANAARVSRGTEVHGTWKGIKIKKPKRDQTQHVTVTIVFYNTVTNGVPSPEDVSSAFSDMENLYKACSWNGNLSETEAGFMKSELTVAELNGIADKLTSQPYAAPKCNLVQNADVFPQGETP